MDALLQLITAYGLLVVFVSVFIDQGGIPIPAYPALIVTAALAADRGEATWPIVVVSVAAALLADLAWFVGGRRFGMRLLRLMCRVSGDTTLILDVRRSSERDETGWIPGSVHVVTLDEAAALANEEVIVYCDCPNEVSAATVAVELRKRGFGKVRPLAGGFEAWRREGLPIAQS